MSAIGNIMRRAGQLLGIGGNPGPQGILSGVQYSTQGAPPVMNTRAMLEGFDSMPWLRAVADKVGIAIAMTDYRLYAVGKAPEPKSVGDGGYSGTVGDLQAVLSDAVAEHVARHVREIRGQLEPWARRDAITQRLLPAARWKNLDVLRKRGMLVEIATHPFYDALEAPNPFMGRMGLMKLTEVSLDLVGDAFWLLQRNGAGAPVGFWPVPANWIQQTPTPSRPYFYASYQSWQRYVPESEILWFHEAAPIHPYERGSGIGFAIGDELEIDEYLSKMTKQMFFNDADPKWIFAGGEGTTDTEMRRLERDFVQKNQGFWRKFKPYFLAGGGDDINKRIHEFQRPTMEQLVYPGLRKAQRDVVLQTWGAPPELFGIVENSNRATVEASEYLFTKWVILPRAERIRSVFQSKLMPQYDPRLIVDFPSPVEEDKEHALAVRKAAPWAWTADEWRHMAGDGPLEVSTTPKPGSVHLVPLNSFVTDDLLDAEQRPKAAAAPAPGDTPPEPPAPTPPQKPKKETSHA